MNTLANYIPTFSFIPATAYTGRSQDEVIADSEEERLKHPTNAHVIELDSTDEDEVVVAPSHTPQTGRPGSPAKRTCVGSGTSSSEARLSSDNIPSTRPSPTKHYVQLPKPLVEVIEISSDEETEPVRPTPAPRAIKRRSLPENVVKRVPVYIDEEDSDGGDVVICESNTPNPLKRVRQSKPNLPSPPKTKAPRISKKKLQANEAIRREAVATDLFVELNRTVFNNRLPENTHLVWNKRLLTTAGRAKWHRTRDGVHNTSIELASKILDTDVRIRNTLSHEMAHLACWIINGDPKEVHGKIWQDWAGRIMQARPDIDITTKHNYDITHPFEWQCEQCSKVYGRFSNSIKPDECVCGVCKEGKLIPKFLPTVKSPLKRKAVGHMVASIPQVSPIVITRSPLEVIMDNVETQLDRSVDVLVSSMDAMHLLSSS